MDILQVFRTIEEIVGAYGQNRMKELLSPKEFTTEEIHMLRGKAQASKAIAAALRNALGYDPSQL